MVNHHVLQVHRWAKRPRHSAEKKRKLDGPNRLELRIPTSWHQWNKPTNLASKNTQTYTKHKTHTFSWIANCRSTAICYWALDNVGNQPHAKDKVATKRSGIQTYQKWWLRLSPKMFQNVVFCCEQDSDMGTSTLAISRVLWLEDLKKVMKWSIFLIFGSHLSRFFFAMTFVLGVHIDIKTSWTTKTTRFLPNSSQQKKG